MGRKLTKENSLATKRPDLAAQWNYEKNGDKKPEDYTCGSKEKVWWILPYDDPEKGHFNFEWPQRIDYRVSSGSCPFLAKLNATPYPGFNTLADTHPNVSKNWNYQKNNGLTPQDVTAGSAKMVWWQLLYDDPFTKKQFLFEWQTKVKSQVESPGCPFLYGRLWIGYNDLQTRRLDIAQDWNYHRNYPLKPTDVTVGSTREVWWITEYEGKTYEWKMKVCERTTHNRGCPGLEASNLEKVIKRILDEENIKSKREKTFKDLKSVNDGHCKYDFYIQAKYLLIEADGVQHFSNVNRFGGKSEFETRVANDNIKNTYAFSHNIPLLRIPYTYDPIKDADKIEKLILDFTKTKQVPQEIVSFYSQFEFSNYTQCIVKCQNQKSKK